jgi:outer membrane protein, heavy metal efflux system
MPLIRFLESPQMQANHSSTIKWFCALGTFGIVGCTTDRIALPSAHLTPPAFTADARTTAELTTLPKVVAPKVPNKETKKVFDLPAAIPGADANLVVIPQFDKDSTAEARAKIINDKYPVLRPVVASQTASDRPSVSLSELQQLALSNSPSIRLASANADAAYGQVIQAGLHPNPTVGYQADQVQPFLRGPTSGTGQHGVFVNQLIKTAGKRSLAQQVVGYDYINAIVDARKAEIDLTASVRISYFAALVAQESLEIHRAVAELADEVYRIELKQVAAGEAAGYEPLPLYAQAIQARNAVILAEATYQAAWKQLVAGVGQPDLPLATLIGRADATAPVFDQAVLKARMIEEHTQVLQARNAIAQAQTNLSLQQRIPTPDIQLNNYHQYDSATRAYQFGIQVGVQLPVSDQNQGNIRTAQARVAVAGQQLATTQNALVAKLAEAFGRYEANTKIALSYREQVLPSLSQAYRGLIRRYQAEPEKVGFSDIVVAQQNLSQALQSYLTALSAQWLAVVDVATVAQLDELFPAR